MLTPALLLLCGMLAAPVVTGDWRVIGFTLSICALGAALYPLLQLTRRRGWLAFEGATPEEFAVRAARARAAALAARSQPAALHQPQAHADRRVCPVTCRRRCVPRTSSRRPRRGPAGTTMAWRATPRRCCTAPRALRRARDSTAPLRRVRWVINADLCACAVRVPRVHAWRPLRWAAGRRRRDGGGGTRVAGWCGSADRWRCMSNMLV